MADTIGLPTVFFTQSAAHLQWLELAHDPDSIIVLVAKRHSMTTQPLLLPLHHQFFLQRSP